MLDNQGVAAESAVLQITFGESSRLSASLKFRQSARERIRPAVPCQNPVNDAHADAKQNYAHHAN
jgi:hypothetical protein